MVGYALGNKTEKENEIQILDEDSKNVVTYSNAVVINLFNSLQNDQLTIPYSTIRTCKKARLEGSREVIYYATNRPDNYQKARSVLELWGFSTYVEYLYTVCELGFLEGLIPVLDLGFLKPDEIRNLSEISALIKIMIDSPTDYKKGKAKDLDKKLLYRKKNIEWSGTLNLPTVTGYSISADDKIRNHNEWLNFINNIHLKFGTIHEVILAPAIDYDGFMKEPSVTRIKDAYKQAREALPEDIIVTIQANTKMTIKDYIDLGIRDLGTIVKASNNFLGINKFDIDDAALELDSLGLHLHQRFPLRKSFIKSERYSKKLGQVFDAFRYKIKKEAQERLKESKV
jgi:7,8-didemethyl-8-hydroxy-5-deazariboflavin synthase CofG subunit